jgi:hypothetical protein
VTQATLLPAESTAVLSADRVYRYTLWRRWSAGGRFVMFVGLNPSKADETETDATLTRCIRFARGWGFDALVMTNLFALRSKDRTALTRHPDPVGPRNDIALKALARRATIVVAAWGEYKPARARAEQVLASGVLGDHTVLRLTAGGHPEHPLYLPKTLVPLDPLTLEPVQLAA